MTPTQTGDKPMVTPDAQDRKREALIVRLGAFADLLCQEPLPGASGDVAYDLLRQAAAQIASDRQHIARHREQETREQPLDLAEENERLREALEEELRDAADTFEKLAASMREEDADLMAPEIAVCEMQRSRIRATLQSISTANGGPGRDGVS